MDSRRDHVTVQQSSYELDRRRLSGPVVGHTSSRRMVLLPTVLTLTYSALLQGFRLFVVYPVWANEGQRSVNRPKPTLPRLGLGHDMTYPCLRKPCFSCAVLSFSTTFLYSCPLRAIFVMSPFTLDPSRCGTTFRRPFRRLGWPRPAMPSWACPAPSAWDWRRFSSCANVYGYCCYACVIIQQRSAPLPSCLSRA